METEQFDPLAKRFVARADGITRRARLFYIDGMPCLSMELFVRRLLEEHTDTRDNLYEAVAADGSVFKCRSSWLQDFWEPKESIAA